MAPLPRWTDSPPESPGVNLQYTRPRRARTTGLMAKVVSLSHHVVSAPLPFPHSATLRVSLIPDVFPSLSGATVSSAAHQQAGRPPWGSSQFSQEGGTPYFSRCCSPVGPRGGQARPTPHSVAVEPQTKRIVLRLVAAATWATGLTKSRPPRPARLSTPP
ncbi:hypothetical protein NDU88_006253 [Pleurodeles waltl]|uniref:Uncharacterized protein n=1 Tax=Pleurodeles waltl TaxID=8319 RepID=A0AAV7NPQ9_PLEWA|nr:hypothetical protein NDU88_006253 [Pleurodeles waltl]